MQAVLQTAPATNLNSLVYVIDDQSTGRKILAELVLTIDPDIQVQVYADPNEALVTARRHPPSLVLVDYKMPEMDGVEFTRRLRAFPNCADAPIVMVTVSDDVNIRYDALEAGATDFLSRPIDQHECRARCRNLLTLQRQQQLIRDRTLWLEQQVAHATKELRAREKETLLRLAKAGEYRDIQRPKHLVRIGQMARLLADELGVLSEDAEAIELAAPLRDIGKIGIPDHVLLKPERHTESEFELMKKHTTIGYDILKDSPSHYIEQGAVIALSHHERFDGSGYPQGLRGTTIPIAARIVAVVDVYDALTSKRIHKVAWSIEDAFAYIRNSAGTQFDPEVVNAFVKRRAEIEQLTNSLHD